MPQMWQPQEPTCLWPFLRQNLEKELNLPLDVYGRAQLSARPRLLIARGRFKAWVILPLFAFFCLSLFTASCGHFPDTQPELEKSSRIFDGDEKVILRAIARVLRDQGFGNSRVEADKGRLETDYVVEGSWRTKVVATIEKIGPKKKEVTLSVLTEKKSSSQWKPKKVMKKEQYDKLFGEIEMQIYREWYERE